MTASLSKYRVIWLVKLNGAVMKTPFGTHTGIPRPHWWRDTLSHRDPNMKVHVGAFILAGFGIGNHRLYQTLPK